MRLRGILCILLIVAFAGAANAETTRRELWRGVWISLPQGAVIQKQPRPIARVLKQVTIDGFGGVIIDLVRQNRGLPYGAEFERRWMRDSGYRNITMRDREGSYHSTSTYRGYWYFNRKIRMSSKQMVEAYFSVPLRERHSKETRRKRDIIMSLSLRKK